jgi:hypothetical protein
MHTTYRLELELDELWYKAIVDLISVDIYDNEICKVVSVKRVNDVRV